LTPSTAHHGARRARRRGRIPHITMQHKSMRFFFPFAP
jgi:hypothetical protein